MIKLYHDLPPVQRRFTYASAAAAPLATVMSKVTKKGGKVTKKGAKLRKRGQSYVFLRFRNFRLIFFSATKSECYKK